MTINLFGSKTGSLFGQNTGGLFGAQNHGGLWGRQTPGGLFGSEPVRVMKKRLLEEKNRFSSLFALNSSQSENRLQLANIQKCQWNLEEIKSFEQQIESDSNVAIKAVNEGLIADIVSNALSSNNKREIQFKSWILLQQILEIQHNQKQDQINIETKENKESDENKNEDSQMFHMPKDFATGLVILSGTEDISIGAQILSGIKDSLSTQLETKERIASDLAKKEIIEILMKPFILIQKEEIVANNQIPMTNPFEQTPSEINWSDDQQQPLQQISSSSSSSSSSSYSSLSSSSSSSSSSSQSQSSHESINQTSSSHESINQTSTYLQLIPSVQQMIIHELDNRLEIIRLIIKEGNEETKKKIRIIIIPEMKVQISKLCMFSQNQQINIEQFEENVGMTQLNNNQIKLKEKEKDEINDNMNEQLQINNNNQNNNKLEQIAFILTAQYLSPDDFKGAQLASVAILENIKEIELEKVEIINDIQKQLININENNFKYDNINATLIKNENNKDNQNQNLNQNSISSNENNYQSKLLSSFEQINKSEEEEIENIQQIEYILKGEWKINELNQSQIEIADNEQNEKEKEQQYEFIELIRIGIGKEVCKLLSNFEKRQFIFEQIEEKIKKQIKLKAGKQIKQKQIRIEQEISGKEYEEEQLNNQLIYKLNEIIIKQQQKKKYIEYVIQKWIKMFEMIIRNRYQLNLQTLNENEIASPILQFGNKEMFLSKKQKLQNALQSTLEQNQQNNQQLQQQNINPFLNNPNNFNNPTDFKNPNNFNNRMNFEQQYLISPAILQCLLNTYDVNPIGSQGGNFINYQSLQFSMNWNQRQFNQMGNRLFGNHRMNNNQLEGNLNQQQLSNNNNNNIQAQIASSQLQKKQKQFNLHLKAFELMAKSLVFGGRFRKEAIVELNQLIKKIQQGKRMETKNKQLEIKQKQIKEISNNSIEKEKALNFIINFSQKFDKQILNQFNIQYVIQMAEEIKIYGESEQTEEIQLFQQLNNKDQYQQQQLLLNRKEIINYEKIEQQLEIIKNLEEYNNEKEINFIDSMMPLLDLIAPIIIQSQSNQRNFSLIQLLSFHNYEQGYISNSVYQQQIQQFSQEEMIQSAKYCFQDSVIQYLIIKTQLENEEQYDQKEIKDALVSSEITMIRSLNTYCILFLQENEIENLITNFLPVIMRMIENNEQENNNNNLILEVGRTIDILRQIPLSNINNLNQVQLFGSQLFNKSTNNGDEIFQFIEFAFQILDLSLKLINNPFNNKISDQFVRIAFGTLDLIQKLHQLHQQYEQMQYSNNRYQQQQLNGSNSKNISYERKIYDLTVQIISIKISLEKNKTQINGFDGIIAFSLNTLNGMILENFNLNNKLIIHNQFSKQLTICLRLRMTNERSAINLTTITGGIEINGIVAQYSLQFMNVCIRNVNNQNQQSNKSRKLIKMIKEDIESEGGEEEFESIQLYQGIYVDEQIMMNAYQVKANLLNVHIYRPNQQGGLFGNQSGGIFGGNLFNAQQFTGLPLGLQGQHHNQPHHQYPNQINNPYQDEQEEEDDDNFDLDEDESLELDLKISIKDDESDDINNNFRPLTEQEIEYFSTRFSQLNKNEVDQFISFVKNIVNEYENV